MIKKKTMKRVCFFIVLCSVLSCLISIGNNTFFTVTGEIVIMKSLHLSEVLMLTD